MNKKILILGKGYIGKKIHNHLNCDISSQKIYTLKDALNILNHKKPKILINCIGFTGKHNVDNCELKIDKTLFSNAYIPIILAEACLRKNVKLVHISSGCIYHYDYKRDKPFPETRTPDYYDLFYSRTKIYSELVLENISKHHNVLLVRIRIPIDIEPHPRNLLTKLIRYKNIIDIPNSVTYIQDFLEALVYLIKKNATGVFNIVNKGGLRYPELLDVYKKYVPNFRYKIITLKDLRLSRSNLILSTRKLEKNGFRVREIHHVLDECVRSYLKFNS